MDEVYLSIQLTGSSLFDNHILASVNFLTTNFPLKRSFDKIEDKDYVIVTGELNPHWYTLFNQIVYGIDNSKV